MGFTIPTRGFRGYKGQAVMRVDPPRIQAANFQKVFLEAFRTPRVAPGSPETPPPRSSTCLPALYSGLGGNEIA